MHGKPSSLKLDREALVAELDGRALELNGRPFDLLCALAGEPGRVFSAQELFAAVWPGRHVEEGNLRVQIAKLRACLGNDAIKNVAGRGYVLTLKVTSGLSVPELVSRLDNLPHWQDSLVGREADCERLTSLLGEHRLVSVLGTGGIGKTRLAQHVARQFAQSRGYGVCWIDLATIRAGPAAAEEIAASLARAVGLHGFAVQEVHMAQALAQALPDQRLLVLFDNAEHVLTALAALLEHLLSVTPTVDFLVTSQQALRLKLEYAYWLDTLSLPDPNASVDDILRSPAIQLLLRRAESQDHRFSLVDQDVPHLARLVRSLDGIALAIEMAAAVLPLVGSVELERHLKNRLLLLGDEVAGTQSRHRTLRAALDWSHALLTPLERSALRQLSFFTAPFRLDSACWLLAHAGQNEYQALRTIKALADKSLVQLQPLVDPEQPRRLRLLETTRLYCQEAWDTESSLSQAQEGRQRYVHAMSKLAGNGREHFYAASDEAWKAQWLPDHADWMQAFDLAHEMRDAASAAQIIDILVLGSNITNNVRPALTRVAASRALAEFASPQDRALLLGWGGHIPSEKRTRQEMVDLRVEVCRQAGDERRLCVALAMQACVLQECGDRERALDVYQECLQLEQGTWPPRLRRRCSWIAAKTLVAYQPTPQELERVVVKSRTLLDELAQQGATLDMTIVRVGMATALHLLGERELALEGLSLCIPRQVQSGAYLEAGLTAGLRAAFLADSLAGDKPDPALLVSAVQSAAEALGRLESLPSVLRAFDHSVAWLACQAGAVEVSATALAASERLRRELRHVDNLVQQRARQSASTCIDRRLSATEREVARVRGASMDAESLRNFLLRWAQQYVDAQAAPLSA